MGQSGALPHTHQVKRQVAPQSRSEPLTTKDTKDTKGLQGQVPRSSFVSWVSFLVRQAGQVVTWQELLAQVWGYPAEGGGREMVRACVKRLRHKLEADPERPRYLTTVWGRGYRWEVAP